MKTTRYGFLAAACSAVVLEPLAGRSQGLLSLRIATLPLDAGSQVYYAQELGIFRRYGLEASVQSFSNGPAVTAAVASGAIDIGYSNMLSIEAAHQRGIPIVAVAPAALYDDAAPTTVLIVPKDSPIQSARDLNGKTIGVNGLRNIAEFAPDAWIDKNGGSSSTVKYVEVPIPATAAALAQHRIDAAVCPEPELSEALGANRVLGKVFGAIAQRFLIGAWFTSTAWANAHPQTVRAFAAAMRDTAVWANTHQKESARILARSIGVDPQVFTRATRARFAEVLTPGLIQPTIDVAAKYGLLTGSFPAREIIYQEVGRAQ
jgi:ABC-type nitrate/sulfonate/bicarbonate transport system substrate-binding protein